MSLRVDATPYDNFLSVLLTLIGGLTPEKRRKMSRLYDKWNSYNGVILLNAVFSKDRFSPDDGGHTRPFQRIVEDASDVIAWQCEGGARPEWLRSITDADLETL
jgi:hypothetical protein